MKKTLRVLILLAISALVLILTNGVYAATVQNFEDCGVAEVTENKGVYTIKLTHDLIDGDPKLSQDLEIGKDGVENVVLDLNGFTLQGFTAGCETIKIYEGSTLKIEDNSVGKTGQIIPATGAEAVQLPLIRNDGSLTIKDGTIDQKGVYGAIINYGTTVIEGGKFIQSETATWSIIDNKGNLTINNGDFDAAASFWMIRNEASLTINGGDFDSNGSANMIGSIYEGESLPAENNVKTEITKGTFNSNGGIFVVYEDTKLEISGGDITSVNSNAVYTSGNVEITGGTIKSENSSAIVVNDVDGSTLNVSADATITAPEGQQAVKVNSDDANTDFGTATDENGNIVAGPVEVTVETSNITVDDNITLSVTVGGVKVSADKIAVSDNSVVKVNADNTLTAIGEGNATITVTVGEIEKTVNVVVAAKEEPTDPENPTDPEEPTDPEVPTNPEEPTEPTNPEDPGIVNTGDYIYIALSVLALVVIANVAYIVIKKKQNK